MSVFREVSFTLNGKELRFVPSVALLRRIQGKGINTVVLLDKCINGGADILDFLIVHQEFVEAAGGKITEDESYKFFMSGNQDEIISFQKCYIMALMPTVDFGKKQEGQGKPRKPRKPKKATKKTTKKIST